MTGDPRPVAWLTLELGIPVVGIGGEELGKVATVVGDEEKDIFHGISVRSGIFSDERLIPADRIEEVLTDRVLVRLSESDLDSLEVYSG